MEITDELITEVRALLPKNLAFVKYFVISPDDTIRIGSGAYRMNDAGKIIPENMDKEYMRTILMHIHKKDSTIGLMDAIFITHTIYTSLINNLADEKITIEDFIF